MRRRLRRRLLWSALLLGLLVLLAVVSALRLGCWARDIVLGRARLATPSA
jgi:hypothetical protein